MQYYTGRFLAINIQGIISSYVKQLHHNTSISALTVRTRTMLDLILLYMLQCAI